MHAANGLSPRPSSVETDPCGPVWSLHPAALGELLRAHFGIEQAQVTHLSGERDLNFRVTRPGLPTLVLKLSDPQEDRQALALQSAALRFLQDRPAQRYLQASLRTVQGTDWCDLPFEDGLRVVRLLTYLEGQPLHASRRSRAQCRAQGEALALLDRALADFSYPTPQRQTLLWDLQQAHQLCDWLPQIESPAIRDQCERVFDLFLHQVQPQLASLRRQFIHNDLNPYNVLVDALQPSEVTGILDFGDMVQAPLVVDAAVAASYQGMLLSDAQDDDALAGMLALLQGYHATLPLQAEELALLPCLMAMRCAITVCITEVRARRHPDNRAYILRNHPLMARGLEALLRDGLEAVQTRLCQALESHSRP